MILNKPETNAFDQLFKHRTSLHVHDIIKNFCTNNKIGFVGFFDYLQNPELEKILYDKIVYFAVYDLLPDFSYFVTEDRRCQQHGKILFIITDTILDQRWLQYPWKNLKFFVCHELLGMMAAYSDYQFDLPHKPKKLFNCFIQRAESVRQSWFYFLHDRNLLDKGYVSFLLKQYAQYYPDNIPLSEIELFDYIHSSSELDKIPKFEVAYRYLRNRVPYRNFEERGDLIPEILDSKYSLVLETFATDDDRGQWIFTDKILRSLQVPTITLFFAQKFSAKILIELGLEIEPTMLLIDDLPWIQRQQALLEIIEKDQITDNMIEEKAWHNRQIFNRWKTEIINEKFFSRYFDQIIKV